MNAAQSRQRWQTYLKWAGFLAPSLFLWVVAGVFVVPKLQQICADAGAPGEGSLWRLIESAIRVTLFGSRHLVVLVVGAFLIFAILEWRSSVWPRYRGITMAVSAFVLNSVVIVSFFLMLIAMALAAPALLHPLR